MKFFIAHFGLLFAISHQKQGDTIYVTPVTYSQDKFFKSFPPKPLSPPIIAGLTINFPVA